MNQFAFLFAAFATLLLASPINAIGYRCYQAPDGLFRGIKRDPTSSPIGVSYSAPQCFRKTGDTNCRTYSSQAACQTDVVNTLYSAHNPLTCGDVHKEATGVTGFENPDSWCAYFHWRLDHFGWTCVKTGSNYRYIRANVQGDPECESYDGSNCVTMTNCNNRSPASPSYSLDWKPVSCGPMNLRLFGVTGYESTSHWCYQARAAVNGRLYSSTLPARSLVVNPTTARCVYVDRILRWIKVRVASDGKTIEFNNNADNYWETFDACAYNIGTVSSKFTRCDTAAFVNLGPHWFYSPNKACKTAFESTFVRNTAPPGCGYAHTVIGNNKSWAFTDAFANFTTSAVGKYLTTTDLSITSALYNQSASSLRAGYPIYVKVTLTNNLASKIRVLMWSGPYSPTKESSIVTLTRGGAAVTHFTKSYKYKIDSTTADLSQYIAVNPYGSFSTVVDISQFGDTSTAGAYRIKMDDLVRDYFVGDTFPTNKRFVNTMYRFSSTLDITVNVAAQVNRNYLRQLAQFNTAPPVVMRGPGYAISDACTTAEIATIRKGVSSFRRLVSNLMYLYVSYPRCDILHSTNFEKVPITEPLGNDSGQRSIDANFNIDMKTYGPLATTVLKMHLAVQNNPLYLKCRGGDCNSNIFAYVQPDSPYNVINLCPAFFATTQFDGYDNMGGTIFHEMTHFNRIAGSQDRWYGATSARGWFIQDPALSITNADSLEYIAEFRSDA